MHSTGDRKAFKQALACVVPASLISAAATYAMTEDAGNAPALEAASMVVSVPVVTVEEAAERAISRRVIAMGSLTPREEVLVAAQVPVEGIRLDAVLVEVGNYVHKGQVMATLGQSVEVTIAGFRTVICGKVRLIDPIVDDKTRLAKVRVALDHVPGLRPGLFAQATIAVDTRPAVVIPHSALQTEPGQGHSIKIVEHGVARTRKVVTGLSDADGIEIVAGIRGGELVVSRAAGFLRDGNRITTHIAGKMTTGANSQSE
jgi:multidrug efflux pump subunit AcrA (membrane-fusion protein)